ncbi:RBBP9/YdeN family alpha/beta hydrolase [Lentzea sp. NPDC060358]|uniref:RBBP9/YdeN family alpha/beta hydrolase n=1 Tax=Lentzea sp. NPDC060358 TaxID=3347103 RepID=UPI003659288F
MSDRSPSRRFLLLHGLDNHRPRDHWTWWLAESLRQRGEQVLYPQFPAPDRPSLKTWTDLLHAELAQLGNRERVVVAHSLGTALWLRAAQSLPQELRVHRVLLVSPLGEQAFTAENRNEEFAVPGLDRERIAAASAKSTRAVVSTTDPYTPADAAAWAAELGIEVDFLPGAGHITPGDGYGPWPGVLRWCLDDAVPVRGIAPA